MKAHCLNKNSVHAILIVVLLSVGCEDFVNIDPPIKELTTATVFAEDATATGAVLGLYSRIWDYGYYFSLICGLSSDELETTNTNLNQIQFYENEINPNNLLIASRWEGLYDVINRANAILKGLEESQSLTSSVKSQLAGETKFMRALSYFYLINLFGDVPLISSSDYRISGVEPRSSTEDVYGSIVDDLTAAQQLLTDEYVTENRARINRASATAMLSRVYLYTGDWVKAEAEADKVISNDLYHLESNLNEVFLTGSSEAILQFFPAINGTLNTMEGLFYLPLFGNYTLSGTLLSHRLINIFEEEDQRKLNWIGSGLNNGSPFYYPFKYKVFSSEIKTEYSVTLRLSEQYLIRAEARTMLGNYEGARDDLNAIRNRAGLTDTDANDEAMLLNAIIAERRVELFGEWGHRWIDLKRYNKADDELSYKPGWEATDILYPIPEREVLVNPNMIQNAGY